MLVVFSLLFIVWVRWLLIVSFSLVLLCLLFICINGWKIFVSFVGLILQLLFFILISYCLLLVWLCRIMYFLLVKCRVLFNRLVIIWWICCGLFINVYGILLVIVVVRWIGWFFICLFINCRVFFSSGCGLKGLLLIEIFLLFVLIVE